MNSTNSRARTGKQVFKKSTNDMLRNERKWNRKMLLKTQMAGKKCKIQKQRQE